MSIISVENANLTQLLDNYCVPKSLVLGWRAGIGFGNQEEYTEDESKRLQKDIELIFSKIVPTSEREQIAYLTAGASCSGKSKLIKSLRKVDNLEIFCISPDTYLTKMYHTYEHDLEQLLDTIEDDDAKKNLKERRFTKVSLAKWKPATYGISHLVLAQLIKNKMSFYFETTSTSPLAKYSFVYYKKHGYKIHLIHLTTPEDVLFANLKKKENSFSQHTKDDAKKSSRLLVQRINDTFFKHAQIISFYFNKSSTEPAVLAAIWEKSEGDLGNLKVHNQEIYEALKFTHNKNVRASFDFNEISENEAKLLYWENSVEAHSCLS